MEWAILCLIPSLTAFQSDLIEQKAYKRLGLVKQEAQFLSHLLIARCDIGFNFPFVRSSVRPQFMSRCLLCSSDSWEYETLPHS